MLFKFNVCQEEKKWSLHSRTQFDSYYAMSEPEIQSKNKVVKIKLKLNGNFSKIS